MKKASWAKRISGLIFIYSSGISLWMDRDAFVYSSAVTPGCENINRRGGGWIRIPNQPTTHWTELKYSCIHILLLLWHQLEKYLTDYNGLDWTAKSSLFSIEVSHLFFFYSVLLSSSPVRHHHTVPWLLPSLPPFLPSFLPSLILPYGTLYSSGRLSCFQPCSPLYLWSSFWYRRATPVSEWVGEWVSEWVSERVSEKKDEERLSDWNFV